MTIRFDLGHNLDLEFSRSNIEFAISLPKIVRLPRNKKQIYRLNSKSQMWPSDLTLAKTLTLDFQGQIWNSLYLSQKWSDCYKTKSKHIDWTLSLKCDHQILPRPWPWLWGQIWNLLYLSQRWFDCHKMKSTHIAWTEGLIDHQIQPWPWPWKLRCKDLPDSDRDDFRCRCAVNSSS